MLESGRPVKMTQVTSNECIPLRVTSRSVALQKFDPTPLSSVVENDVAIESFDGGNTTTTTSALSKKRYQKPHFSHRISARDEHHISIIKKGNERRIHLSQTSQIGKSACLLSHASSIYYISYFHFSFGHHHECRDLPPPVACDTDRSSIGARGSALLDNRTASTTRETAASLGAIVPRRARTDCDATSRHGTTSRFGTS